MSKKPTILSSQTRYTGPAFTIVEKELAINDSLTVTHATVVHSGAVVIIPVQSDGSLLLVRQYRPSIDSYIEEFPAGTLKTNEPIEEAANRELSEEVGFYAQTLHSLGSLYPVPGFCDEIQHGYLAMGLIPRQLPSDPDEFIEIVSKTTSEFEAQIISGYFQDSKSIAFYSKAKLIGLI